MTATIDTPFVGPRTFEERDSPFFFGREREARHLLSLVISEPLTLFYAQSGAGKSSLINTRLIPGLRQEGFAVLPVGRVGGALPEAAGEVANVFVFNLLLSLDQGARPAAELAQMTLAGYLQAQETRPPNQANDALLGLHSRVLIIDQFEEIVTTHPEHWAERQPFFQQLNEAIAGDPHLWVVLTLREDHLAALDPYSHLLAGGMRSRFHMQRMETGAALDAVQKPAEAAGRPFAPGVAETLIDNLRQIRVQAYAGTHLGQFVEPVQLQVVCYQLWQQLQGRPLGPIVQQDLDELGNVDQALAQFYEQALAVVLAATKVPEVTLRNWFERQLITEAGTRGTVYQGPQETAGLSNAVVHLLANQYLLRAEPRAGGAWYELVHDRFVMPILQANQEWRLGQSPLIQAAEAWERAGRSRDRLYQGEQLKEALATVNRETTIPLVQQFLDAGELAQSQQELAVVQAEAAGQAARAEAEARRARRLRYLSLALVLMVLVGLVAAAMATGSSIEANQSRATAVAARRIALAEQGTAQAASAYALEAQATAEAASTVAVAQQATAEAASTYALEAQATAEAASTIAVVEQATADVARATAIAEQATAEAASDLALVEQQRAQAALAEADAARRLQLIQSLAFHILDILRRDQDTELALLLAQEAYRLNEVQAGGLQTTIDRALLPLLSQSYFNTRLPGGSGLRDLAFQPDGQTLVATGSDGLIWLWPRNDLNQPPAQIDTGGADFIALAGDGLTAVTATAGGLIRAWDLADYTARPVDRVIDDTITALDLSPDGRLVAFAVGAGRVQTWSPQRPDAALTTLDGFHTRGFETLVFSADGSILTACCSLSLAWRINDNLSASILSSDGSVRPRLATLSDGRWGIFAGAGSLSITLLERPVSFTYTPETSANFRALDLSADGRTLASAWDDGQIRLLRLGTFDPRTTAGDYPMNQAPFARLPHQAIAVRFSPDGEWLASAGADGVVRLWQPNVFLIEEGVSHLAANEQFLAGTTSSGSVYFWSLSDVLSGAASPLPFSGAANPPRALALSPDGHLLAAGDGLRQAAGNLYLWQRNITGNLLARLAAAHQRPINALTFSPDGQWLASGSGDGGGAGRDNTIRLWQTNAQNWSATTLGETPAEVTALAFAPQTAWLASGELDGALRLWPLDGGAVTPLPGHTDAVTSITFAPDGSQLASASRDGTIRLWLPHQPNAPPAILSGHSGAVAGVAYTPDGRLLASLGDDGTIRFWQLEDRSSSAITFQGHNGPGTGVAFTGDGNYLVTAGQDAIRLWPTLKQLRASACERVQRNLTWDEWRVYMGDEPYRRTCPNLPAHYTVPGSP